MASSTSKRATELPSAGGSRGEQFALIREAGQRAAHLTRALLAFSRQQVLQTELVEINDLAAQLATMLEPVLGEQVRLELVLARGLWPVLADPNRLEQVLVNLAVNAKDAMPAGGVLRIETENRFARRHDADRPSLLPPGEYVRIRVIDQGCGIPEDILPRIFEPFFTTKDADRGTGLGLATAYGIVKQSDGYIFVDSSVGRGATFTVYLPRAKEGVRRREAPPAPRPAAALTGTVLVVEDEPRIRAMICQMLRRFGYSVLAAGDGEEALGELAGNPHVDLVLTDIVMPGMSLQDLLREVQARSPSPAVVLMSGYGTEVLRGPVAAAELPLLEKPFTQEQLLDSVLQTLRSRGAAPAAPANS
jgi:two-component system cell cycle sensor histidine kinase/response regulator CckA